ncbi:MAG TPA: hypothetical protein VH089_05805, partial [Streptosporangiaceae bacterium]|nr:hypothetical protein [Streptosporangiaceae bacterium]
ESRRRWPAWAALLVGAASGPQAAASGFRSPYTMVDTATATIGVLLAVAVLATAGRTGPTGPIPAGPGVSRDQSRAEPGCLEAGCDGPRVPPSAPR